MKGLKSLKAYSKYLKKYKALEKIMQHLKEKCILELKKEGGYAIVDDVEYHITKKMEFKFMPEVEKNLKELKEQIEIIKMEEKNAGRVEIKEKETFDAYIPKSNFENIVSKVPEYKKYFGI